MDSIKVMPILEDLLHAKKLYAFKSGKYINHAFPIPREWIEVHGLELDGKMLVTINYIDDMIVIKPIDVKSVKKIIDLDISVTEDINKIKELIKNKEADTNA